MGRRIRLVDMKNTPTPPKRGMVRHLAEARASLVERGLTYEQRTMIVREGSRIIQRPALAGERIGDLTNQGIMDLYFGPIILAEAKRLKAAAGKAAPAEPIAA